jgi:hypothetical protein
VLADEVGGGLELVEGAQADFGVVAVQFHVRAIPLGGFLAGVGLPLDEEDRAAADVVIAGRGEVNADDQVGVLLAAVAAFVAGEGVEVFGFGFHV